MKNQFKNVLLALTLAATCSVSTFAFDYYEAGKNAFYNNDYRGANDYLREL